MPPRGYDGIPRSVQLQCLSKKNVPPLEACSLIHDIRLGWSQDHAAKTSHAHLTCLVEAGFKQNAGAWRAASGAEPPAGSELGDAGCG